MNLVFISAILLLSTAFLFIWYIYNKKNKENSKIIGLEIELQNLLNINNFVDSVDSNPTLKQPSYVNSIFNQIEENQTKWELLIQTRFRTLNHFDKEDLIAKRKKVFESLKRTFGTAQLNFNRESSALNLNFLSYFVLGFYESKFDSSKIKPQDFLNSISEISKKTEISQLDSVLFDLSKIESYFDVLPNGNYVQKDARIIANLRNQLELNIQNWKNIITTFDKNLLSEQDVLYIKNREKYANQLFVNVDYQTKTLLSKQYTTSNSVQNFINLFDDKKIFRDYSTSYDIFYLDRAKTFYNKYGISF